MDRLLSVFFLFACFLLPFSVGFFVLAAQIKDQRAIQHLIQHQKKNQMKKMVHMVSWWKIDKAFMFFYVFHVFMLLTTNTFAMRWRFHIFGRDLCFFIKRKSAQSMREPFLDLDGKVIAIYFWWSRKVNGNMFS